MRKYTAIILDSRDIGEFDRLYILYTLEQGLVKSVAKGVRKQTARLAGHLEPGTLSEVYVAKARGRGQITSAITLENFKDIKKDFEKLREALKAFRFFGRIFSEGEKDEKIFGLLEEYLAALDRPVPGKWNGAAKLATAAFWWKIFDLLGHKPEVAKCVSCRSTLTGKQKYFFSAEKGGAVCPECAKFAEGLESISQNQIKFLRLALANPLGKIVKVKIQKEELLGILRLAETFQKYNF